MMNGKKVAIYFVGFIILVCILIVVIMQVFFATYEPKPTNVEAETSIVLPVEDNMNTL
ncbi:hypothetical protein [Ureibacillus aquaedulcis]|uniref:Uncharacterized protein n=1 Tax=Ureibacillus aquaedulcis TaxID=3058421 RepID=A0ABT8GUY8_9BACL|nr:hypothetical protein [Ureibacillus sp. BA0131]MDN4495202.1 hypothetical protein [Ureibacillus sp. BA0131]